MPADIRQGPHFQTEVDGQGRAKACKLHQKTAQKDLRLFRLGEDNLKEHSCCMHLRMVVLGQQHPLVLVSLWKNEGGI